MKKKIVWNRKTWIRLALLAAGICFFAFLFWLNQVDKPELVTSEGRTFERAQVVKVLQDNIQENGRRYGEQKVVLRMLTGPHRGEELEATSSAGYLFGAGCTPGMRVIAIQSVSGDITVTSVFSADRELAVYGLLAVFGLCICLIGRRQGVKACVGLVFTFICLIFMYLPLVFRGFSPFWAAVLVCVATTFVTLYLVGGPNKKTACAIAGTIAGVVIAGAVATIFGQAAGISGYNVSNIEDLLFLEDSTPLRVGGLLFSGLLISSLGAVMDVAMSIASTVEEVHLRRPELGRRELFESGMHVGRDTMGTMSNTLILAFAGGSLGVLVTYYAYQLPYLQIINSYGVGIEIMQGISGSMGIILTVPIVSAASATWMAPARAAEGAKPLPLPRRIERAVSPAAGFLKKYWKLLAAPICIAVLVLCAGKLYRVFSAYAQGGREYEAVRSSVETPQPGAAALSDAAAPTAEEKFRFDFGRLAAQNPDAVGWLRLPGTALSYPVVQGKDNSYYLTHTFSRRENKVGAVFLDSRIRQGLSAPNCVVYGHNMNDGSMFASVWEFRNKSYFQAHPVIELYSKSGEKVCPVFSAHEVKPDGDAYRLSFSGSKAYGAYLKQMKKDSLYDTGVDVAASDRVLTLSTCVRDGRDVRFLVHAKIPG